MTPGRPMICPVCRLPCVPFGGEDICMGEGDCGETLPYDPDSLDFDDPDDDNEWDPSAGVP